jgi:hypothetical protein
METKKYCPFLTRITGRRGARTRRMRQHLALVATLGITSVAIAVTGALPHLI